MTYRVFVLPKLSFLVREGVFGCARVFYVSACLKSARSLSSSRVWRNLVGCWCTMRRLFPCLCVCMFAISLITFKRSSEKFGR